MRSPMMLAVLAGTIAASQPASAQNSQANQAKGGIPTETQERLRAGDPTNDVLNWLGLIGLIGLLGLRRGHDEDSYHPTNIE